ncbi:ABC transporter ATP-binding protein [Kribbella sp. NPDC000426]|uniref:ABC transporter ATP-binding protein n=1 Tax=Kribbella sp. NPDC000426 TaxID=3154255 RepID=UPI003320C984
MLTGFAETAGRYGLHARLLWRACPGWTSAAVLTTVLSSAVGTVLMISTGQFVGSLPDALHSGAGSPTADEAWRWFVVTAVLLVSGPLLAALMGWVTAKTSAGYVAHVFELVAQTGLHPQELDLLDSPGFSGRLQAVVEATRDWTFAFGLDNTWTVVARRLTGIGAVAVLLSWRWWAPFLIAGSFMLLSKTYTTWLNTAFDKLLQSSASELRRARYVRGLLVQTEAAKEVRLFGLTDWLVDRYRATWLSAMATLWPLRKQGLRPVYLACLVMAIAVGGALALLVNDVATGVVGLAGVITLTQAVLALEAFGILGDPQMALGQSTAAAVELARLRREIGLPETHPAVLSSEDHQSAPSQEDRAVGVVIENVAFTYPTRDEPALSGLSLHIPAGQSVAIVGVNGAGKSTVIKLLCGLYRPDQGTVRVDGADPAESPAARRRVAVIFQDFVRYHLSLRDNVGFGAVARRHDQRVLDRALVDAGGNDLLDRLEHGWDTVLSAEYEGGTDLSGGQWQRVALARALAAVAGGAGVLILDEPTAALDVRAEAALFDRFLQVTQDVTTILVSHRLSSVRHVDRIVVLDPGAGIVEDGSHDELMRAGGRYAEMFTLQARRFAQAGSKARAGDESQEPVG